MKHFSIILFVCVINLSTTAHSAALSISDQTTLMRAAAEERKNVIVMLVAKEEKTEQLRTVIKRLRGTILFSADEVGYYRVMVPLKRTQELIAHEAVQMGSLGEPFTAALQMSHPLISNNESGDQKTSFDEYIKLLDEDPRYDGLEEMNVKKLREENPNYDGRGVTIAVIEGMPDPFTNELSVGRSISGEPSKKVKSIVYVSNQDDSFITKDIYRKTTPGLVRLTLKYKKINNDTVKVGGKLYRIPVGSTYKFGLLNEEHFKEQGRDLNKDGNPLNISRIFLVAWDKRKNCVLVDTNQNEDLRDEECLLPYNEGGASLYFRKADNESSGVRFFIASTTRNNSVFIAVPNEHTHSVAAVAAGQPFAKGKISGVAPGAHLVMIGVDYELSSITEASILAARDEDVDIIVPMISGDYITNPANEIDNLVIERLSKIYGKIVIGPAGNRLRRLSTIKTSSRSEEVMAVGQYHGERAWRVFTGTEKKGGPADGTSSGPAPDGTLKPDIMGSSLTITPLPEYLSHWEYTCPNLESKKDRRCFSGTSSATPAVAGVVAVLLSAARQNDFEPSSKNLRNAVYATARFIDGASVAVQGRGLVDAYKAWEYLNSQKYNEVINVEVEAPVSTGFSARLDPPHTGGGLYEREAWSPGSVGSRVIKLRRTTGKAEEKKAIVKIIGNEHGTFSTVKNIALPLNEEISLEINIRPSGYGVFSSILRIESFDGTLIRDIGLTIVSAVTLEAENGFRTSLDLSIDSTELRRGYVNVPPGTAALRITHDHNPAFSIYAVGPLGTSDGISREKKMLPKEVPEDKTGYVHAIYSPAAGVWELSARDPRYLYSNEYYDKVPLEVEVTAVPEEEIKNDDNVAEWSNDYAKEWNLRTRIVWASRYSGTINGLSELKSGVIKFAVERPVVRVDAQAEVIDVISGHILEEILSLTLMKCEPNRCEYYESAAGIGKAKMIYGRPSPGEWAVAVTSPTLMAGKMLKYKIYITYSESNNGSNMVINDGILNSGTCNTEGFIKEGAFMEIYDDNTFWSLYDPFEDDRFSGLKEWISIPLHRSCLGVIHY